jgi:hypothetical protein
MTKQIAKGNRVLGTNAKNVRLMRAQQDRLKILAFSAKHKYITSPQVQDELHMTKAVVEHALRVLSKNGCLRKQNINGSKVMYARTEVEYIPTIFDLTPPAPRKRPYVRTIPYVRPEKKEDTRVKIKVNEYTTQYFLSRRPAPKEFVRKNTPRPNMFSGIQSTMRLFDGI